MRTLAKVYLTYEGARKRAAFERAHGHPTAQTVRYRDGIEVDWHEFNSATTYTYRVRY